MDRQIYSYKECESLANENGLGKILWEERIAKNTGNPIQVGYVYLNNKRNLFCKKSYNEEKFYLCNDFEKLGR